MSEWMHEPTLGHVLFDQDFEDILENLENQKDQKGISLTGIQVFTSNGLSWSQGHGPEWTSIWSGICSLTLLVASCPSCPWTSLCPICTMRLLGTLHHFSSLTCLWSTPSTLAVPDNFEFPKEPCRHSGPYLAVSFPRDPPCLHPWEGLLLLQDPAHAVAPVGSLSQSPPHPTFGCWETTPLCTFWCWITNVSITPRNWVLALEGRNDVMFIFVWRPT